jgi:hypothetical protein
MLICGLISCRTEWLAAAAEALIAAVGPVELASEAMAFDFTHYYDAEMGTPLLRRFLAFAHPFDPAGLADAKLATNAIEADFARRLGPTPPRPINLDPGYLESSKLVLASMKNFSHRVYLRSGVYAEVTMQFRHGRWTALEWTFPDYASGRYDAFLSSARASLRGRDGAADGIARAAPAGGASWS